MNTIVNYRLICFIGLMGLSSCKLYQNKSREELQSSSAQVQKDWLAQRWYGLRQDSLSRYWYFASDSGFHFHPDSGLTGQQGMLFMRESKSNASVINGVSMQASDMALQKGQKSTRDKRSSLSAPKFWLLSMLLLGLMIGWRFRKSFKAFPR
ncbi:MULTISPECIES: hypothetical protein [Sphingobacterium]|uniref:hypothetical protein n=1 Tax=Sphingobacterium TaxID=28453 RepID=UPI00257E1C28|nr:MULTISPECIES: hypothetical protein [Sphingobacterium]